LYCYSLVPGLPLNLLDLFIALSLRTDSVFSLLLRRLDVAILLRSLVVRRPWFEIVLCTHA
jgi:hypothetical protein